MIDELYSEFDSDLTIQHADLKTFNTSQVDFEYLASLDGVSEFSRVYSDQVILRHEDKWVNADIVGVEKQFLFMANVDAHIYDGYADWHNEETGLIGASLLNKLDAFVSHAGTHEVIQCYVPKRKIKLRLGKSPFTIKPLALSGALNYNKDVNSTKLLAPLGFVQDLVGVQDKLTSIDVNCQAGRVATVKRALQDKLGKSFSVRTMKEKNALIYKTSQSEKLMVVAILVFVFVLAAFNLISSIVMLFVEKSKNIDTMFSFGANTKTIFRIFFLEGIMVATKGIVIGVSLGLTLFAVQKYFGVIVMPNAYQAPFPVGLKVWDVVWIVALLFGLSALFVYLPVKYLVHRKNTQFFEV